MPWGEYHNEVLHGQMCSLLDACHRAKGNPLPPSEYMPFISSINEKPQQSESEMKAIWTQVVAVMGDK